MPPKAASPLPPEKPMVTGKQWPKMTPMQASIPDTASWGNSHRASRAAMKDLATSKMSTKAPAFRPSTMVVLVAPRLPVPSSFKLILFFFPTHAAGLRQPMA